MKTITVQIGNSDDKLTQARWADFSREVDRLFAKHARKVYFSGFSRPDAHWQNACMVGDMTDGHLSGFRAAMVELCKEYNQENFALTIGTTELVGPNDGGSAQAWESIEKNPPMEGETMAEYRLRWRRPGHDTYAARIMRWRNGGWEKL
jgi:hypothetical protein